MRFVAADDIELPQFAEILFLSEDRVLVRNETVRNRVLSPVDIYEIGLGANPPPTLKHTVHLPPDSRLIEMRFAPQGDRIAWFLLSRRVPALSAMLHRLFPWYRVHPTSVAALWVSRSDGCAMREIGCLEIDAKTVRYGLGLQWLPDGRQLSFACNDSCYTVPAE